MRKLRWSEAAADDLDHIYERIKQDNPEAARQTVKTIYEGLGALRMFPHRGRRGAEEGSRELVFTPLPYVAVYRITPTHIEISRIWHGAQRRL
ncbi:MAG TPA: type II toxin-antitoxin system RelE/ParE family toxin [Bryobacteraceae bacterium]|nr:type II toxin-antitoxin system RelE/ParE family toxin [Bryobacteraceae bacterium]